MCSAARPLKISTSCQSPALWPVCCHVRRCFLTEERKGWPGNLQGHIWQNLNMFRLFGEKKKQGASVNMGHRILGLGYLLRAVVSHLRPSSLEALRSPLAVWWQLQRGRFLFKVAVERRAFSLWQQLIWWWPHHLCSHVCTRHPRPGTKISFHIFRLFCWLGFVQQQPCVQSPAELSRIFIFHSWSTSAHIAGQSYLMEATLLGSRWQLQKSLNELYIIPAFFR